MTQQQVYQSWKPTVLGHGLDIDRAYGDQCVDVDLSYGLALFPGVAWSTVFPPTFLAKNLGDTHNPVYFDWIVNDHNNPNQLPMQGDIIVSDATPQAGYTNTFPNPAGHTGVVDSCNSATYTLIQQDGTNPQGVTFMQTVAWRYRPVLGWLRPKLASDAPLPSYYTVVRGDTMSHVAAVHGMTLAQLEHLNPQVTNPNLIYPGEKLRIS